MGLQMRNLTLLRYVAVAGWIVIAACSGKQDAAHAGGTGASGTAGTAALAAGNGAAAGSSASAGHGASGSSVQTSSSGAGGTIGGGGRDSTGGSGARGAAGMSPMSGGSGQGGGGDHAGQGGVGGQAGAAGGGGSGSKSCGQLDEDYAQALQTAKMCDVRASGQCQQVVASKLGCYCMTHVSEATTLNAIKASYEQAGCPMATCPGVACVSPGTGACTMINSGDFCN